MDVGAALVRAAMGLNPATAFFAQLWGEHDNYRAQENIREFCNSLQEQILNNEADFNRKLKEQKCSLDEMRNLVGSLNRTVDCLLREHEFSKIELLSCVTINCVMLDSLPWDNKIRMIDSFRQITMKDIAVLKQFRLGKVTHVKDLSFDSLEEVIPSLCKLSSIGFITQTMFVQFGKWTASEESEWESVWKNKSFELLPSGNDFLTMISGRAE